MRICTRCKEPKFISEFAGSDNSNPWCKECMAWSSRRYYRNNKSKVLASHLRWTRNNRERYNAAQRRRRNSRLEETRAWNREYLEKNKEKINARRRERYQQNLEANRAKAREGYKKYSERYKEQARRRKNRLKTTIQEPYTKQFIYDRDKGLCFKCSKQIDLSLKHPNSMCFSFHHLIPILLGGQDTLDNVVSSHLVCNLRQGTKPAQNVL